MKNILLVIAFFVWGFANSQCPTSVTYSHPKFTFNYSGSTPSGTYSQIRVTISSGKGVGGSYILSINTNSGTTIVTNNGGNSVDSTSVASKIEYYQSGSHAGLPDCNTSTPLPVKLLKFNAVLEGNISVLNWVTATEINNDKFEIYRSTDGVNFIKIGEVKGNGNTNQIVNYTFTDQTFENCYYRLKQIDYNGQFEYFYSNKVNVTNTEIVVYPNPCTTELNIVGGEKIELLGIEDSISDKIVKSIDTSNLPSGIYTLIIDGKIYKVVKQ